MSLSYSIVRWFEAISNAPLNTEPLEAWGVTASNMLIYCLQQKISDWLPFCLYFLVVKTNRLERMEHLVGEIFLTRMKTFFIKAKLFYNYGRSVRTPIADSKLFSLTFGYKRSISIIKS